MKIRILNVAIVLLGFVGLTACTSQPQQNSSSEPQQVKLVYTDWSEAVALSQLSKLMLEEEMGFEVQLKLVGVDSAYAELARGDADVFADAWLPETQSQYWVKYADSLEKLSILYPHARTGLVVPEYSRFHSIEDLKASETAIVGIEADAGIMFQTRRAIMDYQLSTVSLKNLSEKEMTTQFAEAYKRMEELVITGWEPHWLFDRFKVRFLDDPKLVFGEQENIYAIATKGLEGRFPQVVRLFERMQLSEKQMNSLIYLMSSEADPEDGVREWMQKNEYLVNQWVRNLRPERKKIM
ncbi:glycine betaine ABC transporter substrate-binding protein [Sunxiuqinia elliptica]